MRKCIYKEIYKTYKERGKGTCVLERKEVRGREN
jgi:hypothetical protein